MKNKKNKNNVEVMESVEQPTENTQQNYFCQDCRFQKSKPSYCKLNNKYTPRKATCKEWKGKK